MLVCFIDRSFICLFVYPINHSKLTQISHSSRQGSIHSSKLAVPKANTYPKSLCYSDVLPLQLEADHCTRQEAEDNSPVAVDNLVVVDSLLLLRNAAAEVDSLLRSSVVDHIRDCKVEVQPFLSNIGSFCYIIV